MNMTEEYALAIGRAMDNLRGIEVPADIVETIIIASIPNIVSWKLDITQDRVDRLKAEMASGKVPCNDWRCSDAVQDLNEAIVQLCERIVYPVVEKALLSNEVNP